jgi:HSP20 family protein
MNREAFNWQHGSRVPKQAERIHKNLLQIITVAQDLAPSRGAAWVPPVNVVETRPAWWVISALPSVETERIDVRLEGDELIIAGTRLLPPCGCPGELKIWEIPTGRFERRLNLPPGSQYTITETRFQDRLLITRLRRGDDNGTTADK